MHEGEKLWEYAVLITDVAYPLEAIGQRYRDRADAEKAFDERKNQWGVGRLHHAGHQPINCCQTVARACALVYIQVCAEGLGQPARFILTGGQVHDVTQPQALLEPNQPAAVVTNKAFHADTLLDCINRKEQRPFGQYQYRNRNVVERFFARLKPFRCIATRYAKLASRLASFVALVAAFLWSK